MNVRRYCKFGDYTFEVRFQFHYWERERDGHWLGDIIFTWNRGKQIKLFHEINSTYLD